MHILSPETERHAKFQFRASRNELVVERFKHVTELHNGHGKMIKASSLRVTVITFVADVMSTTGQQCQSFC
jgi:hypothetical protein